MKNQHVLPIGAGWGVYPEGSTRFKVLAFEKEDAIEFGWKLVSKAKVDLVIHDREGKIESVRSARTKKKK